MHILWRIVATLSLVFISFVFGAWLAGQYFVPAGSGLAGGAIVLTYGLGASLAMLIVSMIFGARLPHESLKKIALLSFLLAVVLAALVSIRILNQAQARQTPESSYLAVDYYSVVMELLDRSDPVLFIKMQVAT